MVVGGMRRGQFAPVPQEDLQNADMRKSPLKAIDSKPVPQPGADRRPPPAIGGVRAANGGMVASYADGGKVRKATGPATAEGRPIGYGDIADLTVNTAKGIGRSMMKTIKGDSKGASDELESTKRENREMSERAADRYQEKGYRDGGLVQHREMTGHYAHGGVVHNLKTPGGPRTLSAAARDRFARNSKGK